MRPISVAAASLALSFTVPASAETVDRIVKRNASTPIGGFTTHSKDGCWSAGIPFATLRTQPRNGKIEIRQHLWTLGKEAGVCAGRRVPGLLYVYTPNKGLTYTFRIQVR
jgi:hypothetical protein